MILMSNIRLGQWTRMWMGWIRTQNFVNWIPLKHVGMGKQIWKQCLVNMYHFIAFWQMVAKRFHVNSNGFFKHFWEFNGWYWTYELFRDPQVTYLQIKRLGVGLTSKEKVKFFKRPKDTIGRDNIFLEYGQMRVYVVPRPKVQKSLMKHAHEELGYFGVHYLLIVYFKANIGRKACI